MTAGLWNPVGIIALTGSLGTTRYSDSEAPCGVAGTREAPRHVALSHALLSNPNPSVDLGQVTVYDFGTKSPWSQNPEAGLR